MTVSLANPGKTGIHARSVPDEAFAAPSSRVRWRDRSMPSGVLANPVVREGG